MEVLQRTANRGSISTGYEIENSLKLEEDNSEYLERATGGGNGDTQKHTISVWVKRTEITKTSFILGFANIGRLRFESDDKIEYQFRSGRKIETNRLFRDTSAWYHIVVVADSTLATATDRMKLYINGVRETDLLTYVAQDQNQGSPAWGVYNTYNYRIGYSGNAGENFNGYIADAYYINGQTLDPTDFGEFDSDTGIWKPKEFTGTFGSLDNYLNFSNSSNLGEDANGGTDLSSNNITAADQATDTPTNNFAVFSQSMQDYYQDLWSVISEGGTKFRCTESDAWITAVSSIGVTSGKWYAEFKITGARPNNMFGIASLDQLDVGDSHLGENGDNWGIGYYQANGNLYKVQNSGYSLISGWGSSISQNQTVGIAVDMDNHNLYLAVNNTYQNSGDPTSGATGTGAISFDDTETVAIAISGYSLGGGNDTIVEGNFGGFSATSTGFTNTDANGYGTFAYAPPSGYYALCGKNLAEYGGTA